MRYIVLVHKCLSSRELSIRNFQDTLVVRRVRKDPSAYGLPGRRISSSQVGNVVAWCMEGDDGGIIMGGVKAGTLRGRRERRRALSAK